MSGRELHAAIGPSAHNSDPATAVTTTGRPNGELPARALLDIGIRAGHYPTVRYFMSSHSNRKGLATDGRNREPTEGIDQ